MRELGFRIAIGILIAALILSFTLDENSDTTNHTNDLNNRRDTCKQLAQSYDVQISYQVKDFNYCMENIK